VYLFWFPGLVNLLNLELLPERHGVLNLGHVGKVRRVRDTQTSDKKINIY
jgi:hypothetical protein